MSGHRKWADTKAERQAKVDHMELQAMRSLLASNVAAVLYDTNKPTGAQTEKARRLLRRKADAGLLTCVSGAMPNSPQTFYLAAVEPG